MCEVKYSITAIDNKFHIVSSGKLYGIVLDESVALQIIDLLNSQGEIHSILKELGHCADGRRRKDLWGGVIIKQSLLIRARILHNKIFKGK